MSEDRQHLDAMLSRERRPLSGFERDILREVERKRQRQEIAADIMLKVVLGAIVVWIAISVLKLAISGH